MLKPMECLSVVGSWLCTLLMQLNPLFGPQLSNSTLLIMQTEWK